MSDRIPFRARPMLATLVHESFDRRGWVYEEYDGFRLLAYKEGTHVTLLSRNSKDRTQTFAGIAQAVAALAPRMLLLDGEVVAFDRQGISRFQLLQNLQTPPQYAVFDCLYKDSRDLRHQPLTDRRAALEEVVDPIVGRRSTVFVSSRLAENGLTAYQVAQEKGYEGVLAKDASSPYVEGRSGYWLKFKVHQEDEFVIVGYTAPAGSRESFGALLLAAHDQGHLVYVGKVGTGFSRERLAELHRKFQLLIRDTAPVIDPPRERNVTWLAPRLVAQIAYEEMTAGHKLRQPVFLGLRDDKPAQDVVLPSAQDWAE